MKLTIQHRSQGRGSRDGGWPAVTLLVVGDGSAGPPPADHITSPDIGLALHALPSGFPYPLCKRRHLPRWDRGFCMLDFYHSISSSPATLGRSRMTSTPLLQRPDRIGTPPHREQGCFLAGTRHDRRDRQMLIPHHTEQDSNHSKAAPQSLDRAMVTREARGATGLGMTSP